MLDLFCVFLGFALDQLGGWIQSSARWRFSKFHLHYSRHRNYHIMPSFSPYIASEAVKIHPNYGYSRTPSFSEKRFSMFQSAQLLLGRQAFKDTILWPQLFSTFPNWSWGLQGTGDCESWAWAHLIDILHCNLAAANIMKNPTTLTASEPIYGFGKAELYHSYRWNGKGMGTLDAARAVQLYGILLRQAYKHDDLSRYSGTRATQWGEYPRKTHGVPDYLEPLAKEHMAGEGFSITTLSEGGAAIEAGLPWIYAGDVRWGTRRGPDGIATSFTSGSHAMCATGVRYHAGLVEAFWIANTGHGDHVTGPVGPYEMPEAYSQCGSWVPASIVEDGIKQGDCYAIQSISGFGLSEEPPIDLDATT
jgi:hypothetical protein